MPLLPWIMRMLVWTLLGTSVQCLDADALPGSESRVARATVRRTLMAITGDYRTTLLEGIVVTAQTILIAGLVLERRRRRQAERLLEQRLEFETLVSELSSRLSMVDRAERPPLITRWLQRLANSRDVDPANLLPATNGHSPSAPLALAATTAWGRASAYPVTDFPALTELVQRGEVVRFDSLEVLPPALARSAGTPRRWSTAIVERLEFVGAILADALNGHDRAGSNGNHHPVEAAATTVRAEPPFARFAAVR